MNLDRAIDLVAQVVLAKAAMDTEWDIYPDIGEHDWQRIQTRIAELTPVPSTEDYHDAYRFLTERATTRSVT